MAFDKFKKFESYSGKARAKGPAPFKPAREVRSSDTALLRGLRLLDRAKVEDGFMVEARVAPADPRQRRDLHLSGIIHLKNDLVSGQFSHASIDGQPISISGIREIRVLVGRMESPSQPIVEDRRG